MPIELAYRIVDVFTDRPLAGNALCVVLDPCPEPVMRAIAREVNLSETTFPVITGDREYDMRILTPADELPFAGHPSLGTAWVLGPGRWRQTTPGATITVDVTADGAEMGQPDPAFEPAEAALAVEALGIAGADGAWVMDVGGTRHLLVLTASPLDAIAPDLAKVTAATRAARAAGLAAVRRLDDAHLHVRVFLPAIGIPEDPGTGAAAGPIGVLARREWRTNIDVTILQGAEMGRPCRIEVHAEEGAVRVGGKVAAVAEGRFTL